MEPGNNNLPAAVQRLKTALGADRRKSIALAVLLTVMLVLAIRLLLGRTLPRRAVATPAAQAVAEAPAVPATAAQSAAATGGEKPLDVDTHVSRDLFKVSVDSYPLAAAARPAERTSAAHLQLQSILPGARPTAIINGLVVGVGDAVKQLEGSRLVDTGYTVASIEDKACIITQQGVAVRLEMRSDR
jgi:hypothetical protein